MIRFTQALLSGIFFTFILDFLFILAIKLHYLDYYGIAEFYNVLFAEHQSLLYFLPLVLLIGFVTTYLQNIRIALMVLAVVFAIDLSFFIPSLGERVGAMVLQKPDAHYNDGRYIYKGTLYYEGRDRIVLFDDELQKLITLEKKDLKP